jgi:hypothetical protein
MNKVIDKYLTRKHIKSLITVEITESVYKSLESLVNNYGLEVFNRNKNYLSVKTINFTIPLMINNNIEDIFLNLKQIKKVKRNSYEHYKLLYGKNADGIYQNRTTLSLQTKENFIKRHGVDKGSKLWNEFSLKKSKQNTLEKFQERFGTVVGFKKFSEYKTKLSYTKTLAYYIKTYGEDKGFELYKERYPSTYDLKKYKDYKKLVYKLSNIQYNLHKDKINPHNYPRTIMGIDEGWQLDHIKSVKDCFIEGLTPEQSSEISNLRMLPWKDNLKRNFE